MTFGLNMMFIIFMFVYVNSQCPFWTFWYTSLAWEIHFHLPNIHIIANGSHLEPITRSSYPQTRKTIALRLAGTRNSREAQKKINGNPILLFFLQKKCVFSILATKIPVIFWWNSSNSNHMIVYVEKTYPKKSTATKRLDGIIIVKKTPLLKMGCPWALGFSGRFSDPKWGATSENPESSKSHFFFFGGPTGLLHRAGRFFRKRHCE